MTEDAPGAATTPAQPSPPPADRFNNPPELRSAASALATRAGRVHTLIGGMFRTGTSEDEAAAALLDVAEQALSTRRALLASIAAERRAAQAEADRRAALPLATPQSED
jgi:hypothetical protein